jgi:NADPH-dependent F420 reductase
VDKETVAIIGGTGNLGLGLAIRWAAVGVPIVIGSREAAKAVEAARKVVAQLQSAAPGSPLQPSVIGLDNAQAAARASVVIVAVPFPAQTAILKSIRGSLQNSIVVDTTVPLAATLGGKATRMVGVWQGSAAELTREIVPAAIPVLGAFHNLSADSLQDPNYRLDCDVLVCGDDEPAKQKLYPLVKLIDGLRPIDAGPLEMARIVESLTALLISLNSRHKAEHAGIRITGVNPPN